ncbi:MAG: winged helix-turn-helix domain-containing protein [Acidimicrobiia bacterium]|nr:winged helix-turn-helix domain-containing protein [Acidimicrobiia bacterium]
MEQECTIRVLGPIDIVTAGEEVSVGGPQARAILGALAIGAGHAVAVDHLHQTLWGDHPPESADNTLQSYISDLRHILGAASIVRVDHAYRLDIDPQNIDAVRFETLLGGAIASKKDPGECLRLCKQALCLWRGRPFGDLADDEAFRLEAYRLDELRLATMELSIEADLALGNNDLVVGELEVAIEEHPYREHLWYLLIEALAGRGRRVEALRTCRRLREVLAEVGVEAGDDLVSLEHRILQGHSLSSADSS